MVEVISSSPTPASLDGEPHRAAREIVGLLHAEASVIGETMARHLHATIPELQGPDEQTIFDETQASCTSNMEQLLGLLARGEPASALVVPDAAVRYAQGLVRRRIPLDVLLRSYRVGHAYLWNLTACRFREEIHREAELLPSLEASAAFMFEYVDLISAQLVAAYHVERDRWVRSAAAVRAETAHQIIDGVSQNEATASARLSYELRRHHVAAVFALDPHRSFPDADLSLEREALAASSGLDGGDVLVIPAGAAVLWAWFGTSGRALELLEQLEAHRLNDGVRMAVGQPAFGSEGFRVTHVEALQAARFWEASPPGRVVSYRAVELVSLLAADLDRAGRFVLSELGPLAARTESAAQLRATLMAFLSCGASHVHAAESLHMHPNTVYKKVRRAEGLLGVPITERRVELTNALMLAESLGAEVLTDL
jgi:hypothetical protein